MCLFTFNLFKYVANELSDLYAVDLRVRLFCTFVGTCLQCTVKLRLQSSGMWQCVI
jgi:hypothetical protein